MPIASNCMMRDEVDMYSIDDDIQYPFPIHKLIIMTIIVPGQNRDQSVTFGYVNAFQAP